MMLHSRTFHLKIHDVPTIGNAIMVIHLEPCDRDRCKNLHILHFVVTLFVFVVFPEEICHLFTRTMLSIDRFFLVTTCKKKMCVHPASTIAKLSSSMMPIASWANENNNTVLMKICSNLT